MKKTLLLLLALVGLVTLQAQVPYQRISTPPTSVKAKQINNKGHESTRAVAKAPKVVVAGIDDVNPDAIEVPFTHGLGKDSNFPDLKTKYTAINANNDNRKWQFGTVSGYGACMVPNAEDINENDDWLITVPVHMPAGDYVVSFELGMMGSGATGVRMDVKLGTSPTVEGMTTQIVPPTVYTEKP